jgi:hypothetical protein
MSMKLTKEREMVERPCRGCAGTKENDDGTECGVCGGTGIVNEFEPAEGRCYCGRTVVLYDPMTNTCGCGREYNGSGQELADRRFWGEETGETAADLFGPEPRGED